MNRRTVLLAGILALAATAVRAEEFQFSYSGTATCPAPGLTCSGPTGSAAVSFDFNTLEGMASYNPGPYPAPPPDPIVVAGSVPITDYLATVDGQTVDFAAQGLSFSFGCFGPVLPNHYECGGNFGGVGFFDNELWMKTLTEAQFNSFKDPLASIFLLNPASFCGGVSAICQMGTSSDEVQLFGPWTITPVPEPRALFLFLAGLVGLVLSGRRKELGSLASTEGGARAGSAT